MGEISQSVEIGSQNQWVRVKALFDTGAEISFIKESIAHKINAPFFGQAKTMVADGRIITGYLSQINMKIQNRIGLVDVIVIRNLDGQLIIGQDWLQKNDVILDSRNEKFVYGTGQPKLKKIYRLR